MSAVVEGRSNRLEIVLTSTLDGTRAQKSIDIYNAIRARNTACLLKPPDGGPPHQAK